jgi:hypothetical protein
MCWPTISKQACVVESGKSRSRLKRKKEGMGNLQRFEAACGLLAALFGLLGLAYALFGPTYNFANSFGHGTTSLVQVGIQPVTLIILGILVLGLICVAAGAVAHSRTGGSRWRVMLWVSTAVLVALTFLSLLSIGVLLLPGTLFALLASALSLGARR